MTPALRPSGVYARWRGGDYHAVIVGQGQVNLLIQAPSPPAGFGPSSRGPDWWARQMPITELEDLASIATLVRWRGHECEVISVLDDERVLLSDDGADRAWAEANAQFREPGVWDVVAPRIELGAVREETTRIAGGRVTGERQTVEDTVDARRADHPAGLPRR